METRHGSPSKARMEPMSSSGASAPTRQANDGYAAKGDALLAHAYMKETHPELIAEWGLVWTEMPEQHACSREPMEYAATFLTQVYKIAGKSECG